MFRPTHHKHHETQQTVVSETQQPMFHQPHSASVSIFNNISVCVTMHVHTHMHTHTHAHTYTAAEHDPGGILTAN